MQVDAGTSVQESHAKPSEDESEGIMSQVNCSAALSIEHLSIDSQETDYIILGFGNGKLL